MFSFCSRYIRNTVFRRNKFINKYNSKLFSSTKITQIKTSDNRTTLRSYNSECGDNVDTFAEAGIYSQHLLCRSRVGKNLDSKLNKLVV